ncbi:MAG TPA: hypothetical protein VF139_08205 [Candidatus Polarisedimenticolaceae bacterium]
MRIVVAPVFCAVMLGAVGNAPAQTESEIALTRKMIETERQAIVAENLGLTEAQGNAFWPLYRDYMNERSQLADRSTSLLRKFAASYDIVDDASASSFLDDFLNIQRDEVALKRSWAGKMRKALPAGLVARFFQIENKLDAYTRALLADEVPLIKGGKPVHLAPKP